VIFGGLGQTLTIRHDSTGRESFVRGYLLAAKEVMNRTELVKGLDEILGLF
jgi:4-hydroxy-tetrahydrodipicolinate reductase